VRILAGLLALFVVMLPVAREVALANQDSPSEGEKTNRLSAETRAIAYLATEVPAWSKENHCFSCHNNGDGARALYTARQLSYPVPEQALTDTTEWLKIVQPIASKAFTPASEISKSCGRTAGSYGRHWREHRSS